MRLWPLAAILMMAVAAAAPALGQEEGEVGVPNVPPSFASFHFQQTNGHFTVQVSAVDFNGRDDIGNVSVEVMDSSGERTSEFEYDQFNATHARVDGFRDISGGWLAAGSCRAERVETGDAIAVRCTLNVTFIITPGEGSRMRITIADVYGLNASGIVPFMYGEGKLPGPLKDPAATVSISGALALALTAVMVRGRMASDRLALAIERRRRKKPADSIDEMMERLENEY
jgi:hypothetical protein